MKFSPIKPKWVVWTAVVAGLIFYRQALYRPDIARPSAFQKESAAGVRALSAKQFEDAERHFVAASKIAEEFDPGDSRRGTSLHQFAQLRLAQKRYEESELLHRQSLAILDGRVKEEAETASILEGLAVIHTTRHEYGAAEKLLRRAAEINGRVFGENSDAVKASLSELSMVLVAQGRIADAIKPATRAAKINEDQLAPVQPIRNE